MRTIIAALLLSIPTLGAAAESPDLPRSTPEAQGIPSSAILAFVEAAEEEIDALHSLMVLRHGHVVAEGWWEPYRREDPHVLFSLSQELHLHRDRAGHRRGKLSLDDTLLSFFPEDVPAEPSDNLKAMRVRDLLSMSTGHHEDAIGAFPYGSTGLTTDVPGPAGGAQARHPLRLQHARRPTCCRPSCRRSPARSWWTTWGPASSSRWASGARSGTRAATASPWAASGSA